MSPIVALIEVDPCATAVATPLSASIVATDGDVDDHVTLRFATILPFASLNSKPNGWLASIDVRVAEDGETEIDVTV